MSEDRLSGDGEEALAKAVKKTQVKADRAYRITLKNYDLEEYETADGKVKVKVIGREAHEIWADLRNCSGDYIKRINDRVFANGGGNIVFLERGDALFGWLASRGVAYDWQTSSSQVVSKSEFLKYIGNIADHYEYAAKLPHYPSVKGFYYIDKIAPQPNGTLEQLISYFKPDTDKDRAILRSAFVTPSWGKGFGNRPGFLIVARDDDEKQGKGTGKTAVTDAVSRIYCGHVDLSKKADDEAIRRALMSSKDTRIARLDNIKDGCFSSETIESIMTAPFISAHRMYKGQEMMPNVYTFFITFNDAQLSPDLSQRCLTIRLRRPEYDPGWLSRLNGFIDTNRAALLADIGALILAQPQEVRTATRFPEWEVEVMAKCRGDLEMTTLHTAIATDRDSVDEMTTMKEEFAERCREKLAYMAGKDPEGSTYGVKQSVVVDWLIEFAGKKRKAASKLLARILPDGFARTTSKLDGFDYLIWSGGWHRGDTSFTPCGCNRLVFDKYVEGRAVYKSYRWVFRSPTGHNGLPVSGQYVDNSGPSVDNRDDPLGDENDPLGDNATETWHLGD